MADGMSSADQAVAPDACAEQSSASLLTLNAEVYRICMTDGGYPAEWPQHPHCPCCGIGQLKNLFTKHQFSHRQCTNCGFVCVDPYPPENILKKLYAGSYYTNFREFYEARHLREVGGYSMTAAPLELLEKMIETATRGRAAGEWLDVGGGLGTVADLVRRRHPRWAVTLNEFNPRSLQLAREIYGLDAIDSDAHQLRNMERRFDVISAVAVLEHIPDPFSFLHSYAELLKPDGILVLIVPQFTRLNAAVSKAASANAAPPFHVSLFEEHCLRVILERIDAFKYIEVSQYGPPAFSLLHHYDTSEYWDIAIPSLQEPVPKGLQIKEYPTEIAVGLNALAEAEAAVKDHFAKIDGRLFLMAVGSKAARGVDRDNGRSKWLAVREALRVISSVGKRPRHRQAPTCIPAPATPKREET
jgi:SAM-dependent methyltransferase